MQYPIPQREPVRPEDRVSYVNRPARKQVEEGQIEKKPLEMTGSTYNIWYGKWAGGDKYDQYNAKEKSQTRCVIDTDSGYTRADGKNKYCCMYFARGCCPKGINCSFLHRLPPPQEHMPDNNLDCFGREKHATYRDDMGGVGSFQRQNRTLYIGKIKSTKDMGEIIERHFDEWGQIEKIKYLESRGVGFVTYFDELAAQFAKEAMMNQSLDHDEVVNVRWATEDPNPEAKEYELKRAIEAGTKGIGAHLTPAFVRAIRKLDELEGIVEPLENNSGDEDDQYPAIEAPDAKRQRIEGPGAGEVPQSVGLLSGTALASLKAAAALRGKSPATAPVAAKKTGLGGLADYGSDSD